MPDVQRLHKNAMVSAIFSYIDELIKILSVCFISGNKGRQSKIMFLNAPVSNMSRAMPSQSTMSKISNTNEKVEA